MENQGFATRIPNDEFSMNPDSGFNPAQAAQTFQNLAGNQLVRDAAQNYVTQSIQKHSGLLGWFGFDMFRPYFNVDNWFIAQKMKLILMPFAEKGEWHSNQDVNLEHQVESQETENKIDKFSVDLYLPLMSLITYVLIVSFEAGLEIEDKKFDPEILGTKASKSFIIWLLEAAFIKFGFALIGVQNAPFLAIFAVSGYKFVDLLIC